MTKLHLEPEHLVDTTTGTPGVVANEIYGEEEALLRPTANYNSVPNEEPETELAKAQRENNGYAVSPSKLKIIMVASYSAAFLSALDMTVVSTLLTPIASDLNAIPNMSWIATSYLLSSAAFQPLYGKLSDIFGRKPILLMCDVLFCVGCIISSFKSFPMLVLGRFITGMGGSGFNTVGTVSMSDIVPLRDRGMFQGFANVAFSVGAASGGIFGGIINDYLGWQWIFILQVPFCLWLGFAYYVFFNLPEGSPGLGAKGHIREKLARVDFPGSITLVSSLVCILLAASLGNQYFSYTSYTFFGLVLGVVVFLTAFIIIEVKYAPEPILPIQLMGNRTVLSSSLANWFCTMSTFTSIFFYPIYLTAVIQLPPSRVGLRVISSFVGVSCGSLGAGLYMRKTGKYYRIMIVACVFLIFGTSEYLFLTPNTPVLIQLIIMTLPNCGYAIMLTVTLLALISAAPVKHQAGTTSIQYTFRSTGSTLGVAIASAIFENILTKSLKTRIPQIVSDPEVARNIIESALKNAEFGRNQPTEVNQAIIWCYEGATKGAFRFSIVVMSMGVVSALFMREHVLHTSVNRD